MKRHGIAALLLFLCVGLTYSHSVHFPFLWDDGILVKDNPQIRRLSLAGDFFSQDMFGRSGARRDAYYRPLQMVSYSLDRALWGPGPSGFHISNWLWHAAAGTGLYFLLLALFSNFYLALAAALLFVSHPAHTASVAYVSGRADPMSAALLFAALCLHRSYSAQRKWPRLLGALAAFLSAVLCKETALAFPVLAVLCDSISRAKTPKRAILAYVLTGAFYVGFRMNSLESLKSVGSLTPLAERLPGAFHAMLRYVELLVWPRDLHLGRGMELYGLGHPGVWMGMALSVGLLILWAVRRKTGGVIPFSIAWFCVTLLPVMNLVIPMNEWMADHWLYLPSVGFFVLVGSLLVKIHQHGHKKTSLFLLAALLVFFSSRTASYAQAWSSPEAFFSRILEYNPGYRPAHLGIGNHYLEGKDLEKALHHFEENRRLAPDDPDAYVNLGVVKGRLGKEEEAILDYQKALSLQATYPPAYLGLADLLSKTGRGDEALKYYEAYFDRGGESAEGRFNLANLYSSRHDDLKAERQYLKAIRLRPGYVKAMNNLGILLSRTGKKKDALDHFQRVLALSPDNVHARSNLANVLLDLGRPEDSLPHFEKAIELLPDSAAIRNSYGVALAQSDRREEAREQFQTALQIDPEFEDAKKNLGSAAF